MSSVRDKILLASCKQPNRGNLTYYASPYGGGDGGRASWGRKKNQLKKREEPAEKERQTCSFRYQETPTRTQTKEQKKA